MNATLLSGKELRKIDPDLSLDISGGGFCPHAYAKFSQRCALRRYCIAKGIMGSPDPVRHSEIRKTVVRTIVRLLGIRLL